MNRTFPCPWWLILLPVTALSLIATHTAQDFQTNRLVENGLAQGKNFAFDDGLSTLRQAAHLEPRDVRVQLELAKAARTLWIFRETAELKIEADRAFEAAKRNSPNWPIPHYEHARMYSAKERYSEALKLLQGALRLDPNNAGYYLEAGRYLEALGSKDEALREYTRCQKLNPNSECSIAIRRLGGQP